MEQRAKMKQPERLMSKLFVSVALCVLLFALSFRVEAQQSRKVYRIGYLSSGSSSTPGTASELFQRELRKLGYVEGGNTTFEYRYANNKHERLPTLADELVHLKIDVLATLSTTAALAAKNATRTIPIVFLGAGDPVAAGLVDSLARPGGNLTGFTRIAEVLVGKRLELLKETVARLSRVAVLWNPGNPGSEEIWKEGQIPARALGLQLHSMEFSNADQLEGVFQHAIKARSEALSVTVSALITSHKKRIAELAVRNRLPSIYERLEFVESGGLMSYGSDQAEPYRRVAVFVDKILKGVKPADIPVEQPTAFEFVINLKAAKQIGLTIPPNVLARADKVIR
jgi:putative tryptophan/tyrosine transport system substrate-binding protein